MNLKNRRRNILAVLALLIVASIQMGCVTAASPYASAAATYTANAQVYGAAYAKLDACTKTHTCSASRDDFRAASQAVAHADTLVYSSLQAWKASGVKPLDYDALASALLVAQTKTEVMASEVKP